MYSIMFLQRLNSKSSLDERFWKMGYVYFINLVLTLLWFYCKCSHVSGAVLRGLDIMGTVDPTGRGSKWNCTGKCSCKVGDCRTMKWNLNSYMSSEQFASLSKVRQIQGRVSFKLSTTFQMSWTWRSCSKRFSLKSVLLEVVKAILVSRCVFILPCIYFKSLLLTGVS